MGRRGGASLVEATTNLDQATANPAEATVNLVEATANPTKATANLAQATANPAKAPASWAQATASLVATTQLQPSVPVKFPRSPGFGGFLGQNHLRSPLPLRSASFHQRSLNPRGSPSQGWMVPPDRFLEPDQTGLRSRVKTDPGLLTYSPGGALVLLLLFIPLSSSVSPLHLPFRPVCLPRPSIFCLSATRHQPCSPLASSRS